MLGDPRKVPAERRHEIKTMVTWLRRMQDKHDMMMFRQDLPGFGEPREGSFDGFARINTDTRSGGIVGLFRQNADDDTRVITVKALEPASTYSIRSTDDLEIARLTGEQLATQGFKVTLAGRYDGALFEVDRVR
jgi:alpha-galactosidase